MIVNILLYLGLVFPALGLAYIIRNFHTLKGSAVLLTIGASAPTVEPDLKRPTALKTPIEDLLATSSAQLANNQEVTKRNETQAANYGIAASSLAELNTALRQTSSNAIHANQLVSEAATLATQGGKTVGDVVAMMGAIQENSKRILEVTGIIDDISHQTNILALNAAVDAARAGEQGRGFDVVASEVRNLAQRSAAAAREIKDLITYSVNEVSRGGTMVDDAGKTISEAVSSVKRVADIMNEIYSSSQEQSEGIKQVNAAFFHMDEQTRKNAILVMEAASAANSMLSQSQLLADLASKAGKEVP